MNKRLSNKSCFYFILKNILKNDINDFMNFYKDKKNFNISNDFMNFYKDKKNFNISNDFMNFYKDKKGFFSIFDGILAILIIIMALMIFNTVINIDISQYSKENDDFLTSQDVMENMALKVNGNSYSTLEIIQYTLERNNNSLQSIEKVSTIAGEFLNNTIPNKSYSLVENNKLNGAVIVANDNIYLAKNISTATRNIGEYSFTLYIW